MDLAEIQRVIETLSAEQQTALLAWLTERDRSEWDAQIERDFLAGGTGTPLLEQVKARVRHGDSTLMSKGRPHR